MARIRTIKPGFWGHSKTARVSRDARLLFLGLLNEADDEGRLLASAKTINGNVFPNDDDVSVHDVDLWMKELASVGFVQLYEVEGVKYCLVRGFGTHQKISHASESRLPAPPADDGEDFAQVSGEDREDFAPEVEVDLGSGTGSGTRNAPAEPLVLVAPEDPLCGFDAFWLIYPKRNGKKVGRSACEAKWRTMSEEDRRLAYVGAFNYAKAVADGLTIAKDPERFLKAKVWNDYLDGPGHADVRTTSKPSTLGVIAALAEREGL